MTKEKKKNPLKVVTPKFRLSFPELFQPKAFDDQDAVYSIKMLFDKKVDLSEMKAVMKKAAREKWGDSVPKGIQQPFVDGNSKDLDGYENTIVVGASTKFKPQVCGPNPEDLLTSADEVYAGCYCRAALIAHAWEYTHPKTKKVMKRGVSFRLESVQKLADGESFVSRPDVTDTFDAVDDGSDDLDNFEDDTDDMFGDD